MNLIPYNINTHSHVQLPWFWHDGRNVYFIRDDYMSNDYVIAVSERSVHIWNYRNPSLGETKYIMHLTGMATHAQLERNEELSLRVREAILDFAIKSF